MNITAKHMELTDALRNHANEQFGKISERRFIQNQEVILGKDGHLIETTVKCEFEDGTSFTASDKNVDGYKSISMAVKKLSKQIDKHVDKIKDYKHVSLSDAIEEEVKMEDSES